MLTVAFGLLGAFATAWLAGRAAPRGTRMPAAALAFILISCNVYQSYFTTIVKTYSLTGLLLVLGFVALGHVRARAGVWAAVLSGLLMALAAGARISAGAALPVAGLYLLTRRRSFGDSRWMAFGVGGLIGLGIWALPFLVLAPEGFRFAMIEYHTARTVGSWATLLVYKAGFLSRFVQAYFVPFGLIVALVVFRRLQPFGAGKRGEDDVPLPGLNGAVWLSALAITVVHGLAPFPYEDYQVFVMPLVAAALAVSLVTVAGASVGSSGGDVERRLRWLVAVVWLVSTAASFSSPINQGWFVRGRDRIWWPLREQSPLRQLSDVAAWIGKLSWVDGTLLTQDIYLAVEAGLDVPKGMEMGPFCYYPEMDTERARRLHVLNRELMMKLLGSVDAPIAAFSGYGLAIRSPEIAPVPEEERRMLWAMVEERYERLAEIESFGQGETTLKVLGLRRGEGAFER